MTREETIEFGNMWLEINKDCKDSNTYAFFQRALEALEQQPCEDSISRILEQIDKAYAYFESGDIKHGFDICKDIIDRELKKINANT